MDKRQSAHIKRISKQQEKRAAEDIGGQTQAASGGTRFGGADVRLVNKYRIECKVTEKNSYTLKLKELEKLKKQAVKSLEQPIFQFAYRDKLGKLDRYAVLKYRNIPKERWLYGAVYSTFNQQIELRQDLIQGALLKGRITVSFMSKEGAVYEVMKWDDFVATQEEECSKSTP
jgi:hypothetical protein